MMYLNGCLFESKFASLLSYTVIAETGLKSAIDKNFVQHALCSLFLFSTILATSTEMV